MLNRRQAGTLLLGGLAAACSPGGSGTTGSAAGRQLRVGHLVGICMAPLFYADARKLFAANGLDVKLSWIPNPGDAVSGLSSGALDLIHNPFTNTFVACDQGANLKIIAGSGNEGLSCVARPESGLRTAADLKKRAGTGLKVGSERINTLELTFYRTIRNMGLSYRDFDMVWFHDHFAMLAAFKNKEVDVVTHVEPFVTQLLDSGGIELSNSREAWGALSPDCVVSARNDFVADNPDVVRRYVTAILRADREIKANLPAAVDVLDKGRYYKVTRTVLAQALPRQLPGVDLTRSEPGMNRAIADMLELGYLKKSPSGVVDLTILRQLLA